MDIDPLHKRYYTVSEVADMFGVSRSLVRFWESEFTVIRPHKTSKGERRFTPENIEQFAIIYELVKERGFTLKGAKKEIERQQRRRKEKGEYLQYLDELKAFLERLRDELS